VVVDALEEGGRLQPVQHPSLRAVGASHFCWLAPLEFADQFAAGDVVGGR
jgi:hypothetical protein